MIVQISNINICKSLKKKRMDEENDKAEGWVLHFGGYGLCLLQADPRAKPDRTEQVCFHTEPNRS